MLMKHSYLIIIIYPSGFSINNSINYSYNSLTLFFIDGSQSTELSVVCSDFSLLSYINIVLLYLI